MAGLLLKLAIDPRGVTFATGGADSIVKVWDLRSSIPLTQVQQRTGVVFKDCSILYDCAVTTRAVCQKAYHTDMYTCVLPSAPCMHKLTLWLIITQARVHTAAVVKVAYNPAGTQLVSVGADGVVAVLGLEP